MKKRILALALAITLAFPAALLTACTTTEPGAADTAAVSGTQTAPETEATLTEPATEAPDTQAPETDAPDTDAPDTDAPETETPDTDEVAPPVLRAVDLTAGVTATAIEPTAPSPDSAEAITDFAVRLFAESAEKGENTLVSPLSVLAALAMTANGASGETLAQMERTLGMTTDELNAFFADYLSALPDDESTKLAVADSIWFNDAALTPERDFLQTNADFYGASAYRAPFDADTVKDVNDWVNYHTDGLIPQIVDNLSETDVMLLVNALLFEASWSDQYREQQTRKGTFTLEDGTEKTADFMYGGSAVYLSDDKATGFVGEYHGSRFGFAALLPNEGVSLADYAASLDGEHLLSLLSEFTMRKRDYAAYSEMIAGRKRIVVNTSIPKFETSYSVDMASILRSMGMEDAFDSAAADFSGIGRSGDGSPLYISGVLHKAFISVDESGTKGGAVAVVGVAPTSSSQEEIEIKEVHLDRPFIYIIFDARAGIPLFIGTMYDVTRKGA